MKKLITIIIILAIVFIVMLINRTSTINAQDNVTITDINKIEEYIQKIYTWKEVTGEALPKFDNINNANDLWIWEVVKKNLEEYELTKDQIQNKAKEIFGQDFTKELAEETTQSFEYNADTQKYYPTQTDFDNEEDSFLLNTITKTQDGYTVEIIEYLEDYSKVTQGTDIVIIKNLNQEEIGQAKSQNDEQNIQDIIKRNIEKFTQKTIYLKQNGENLYVQKIE